jgi:thiol-disulfide isomerase/thioredoxin
MASIRDKMNTVMKLRWQARCKPAGVILSAGALCAGIAAASGLLGSADPNAVCSAPVEIVGANAFGERAAAQKTTGLPVIDLAAYKNLMAKYRGKPVLVNFWATWCQPCRSEYPMLAGLAKEYQSKGVVFLGVSYDEGQDLGAEENFLAMYRPDFPNFRLKPGIDVAGFNRALDPRWTGSLPSTIFYRRDGRPLMQFYGTRPRAEFENGIERLLSDPFGGNPGK